MVVLVVMVWQCGALTTSTTVFRFPQAQDCGVVAHVLWPTILFF